MTDSEEKKVILIVDDEELNRSLLVRRLGREGYETVTACDGPEALEIIERQHIDMVLLDVMMPIMDGFETLKHIREKHSVSEIPVIMATALGDSSSIVNALNGGASDYVTKPINFAVLKARMQSIFARIASASKVNKVFKVEIGSKLGVYKVMSEVGSGATSVVYLARDTRLNRPAALKVLKQSFCEDSVALARFVREAKSIAKIEHPGVVDIYDIADTPCHYLAMEFLNGTNFADIISKGPLPVVKAVNYCMQIADILASVHSCGIIHRDLKPQNLILDEEGKIRLMDFGLAKVSDGDTNLTASGTIVGTPKYISPEQIDNEIGDVSFASDIYSLGLILHEMLTGAPAIKGESIQSAAYEVLFRKAKAPSSVNPDVPESLDRLCLQMQSLEPDKRPQSAEEVVNRLKVIYSAL